MASTNIAYMPQDISSPYFPEPSLRASQMNSTSSRNAIWSNAVPATPQSSTASTGTVWGSPLIPASASSSFQMPARHQYGSGSPEMLPKSLAALTAESEPVLLVEQQRGTALSAAKSQSSTSSSRFSSRHNSQTDTLPPSPTGLAFPLAQRAPSPSPSVSSADPSSQGNADEIINTAIVVKNIPFAIKKEQLIEFMVRLGIPLPYAFNYHFDNGVFRGLAFANFATAEETAEVITSLNGRELGGRKLRVEYKKMLPYQERERIEREKRERRGQLEEQHQHTSGHKKTETSPKVQSPAQNTSTSTSAQRQRQSSSPVVARASHSKSAQTATAPSLTKTFLTTPNAQQFPSPLGVDMNVLENLQMYTTLLVFKRDSSKLELILPPAEAILLSPALVQSLNLLCKNLDLNVYGSDEQGVVISKRPDSSGYKADQDSELYQAGIFKNAIATPAPFPLTHMGMPTLSAGSSLNPMNRWAGIGATNPINFVSK